MEPSRLRALIVDDEEYARKNLVMMIDEFCPEIEVIGEASGKEQEKFLNRMATKDLENPVIACQENENTSESISEENSEPNEINPIASKYKG
ncbi:MAG: hypothetical protein ACK46Y_12520, partial [Fluviicola sp.]